MMDYRIKPDCRFTLKDFDPDETGHYKKNDAGKAKAKSTADGLIAKLDQLQERLYANGNRALLVVLQGMDTSGKDGTIKSVMSGVNPQGCRVASFKAPSGKNSVMIFFGASIRKYLPRATSAFLTGRITKTC